MKLLLTSGGISNQSIRAALVELLGKPVEESSALFVPTAILPFPDGPELAWQATTGRARSPMTGIGWKSVGVLELTALPTIGAEVWEAAVRATDALLVWGGDVLYLTHWMKQSGLADLLPALLNLVYVGISAGSIALTPFNYDAEFNLGNVPAEMERGQDLGDRALGLVDFTLVPHLDHPMFGPEHSAAEIEKWAGGLPVPTYALDDDSAITVVDGAVEVISEGSWHRFGPG
jgi:dipeptidase E